MLFSIHCLSYCSLNWLLGLMYLSWLHVGFQASLSVAQNNLLVCLKTRAFKNTQHDNWDKSFIFLWKNLPRTLKYNLPCCQNTKPCCFSPQAVIEHKEEIYLIQSVFPNLSNFLTLCLNYCKAEFLMCFVY